MIGYTTSQEKPVTYDLDGFDVITTALRDLLSQYPGLDGDSIQYATLGENSGKAMFPVNGSQIERERESITGHVTQICLYPFVIIYRGFGLSENRKATVKEWLDNLGRWLERQELQINGEKYKLDSYPELTGNRKFLSISRQTPAYLDSTNENKSENWAIYITARYQNEFDR